MDYMEVVRGMLDDYGHAPNERLETLLTALGTGIAASTVIAETKALQDELLELLFQCIREDAMERYNSYDRFLNGDHTYSMPTPGQVQ